MLLVDLRDVAFRARQAHRQLVAKTERGVIPPIEPGLHDRQVRPLRELLGDQPSGDMRRDLAPVHGNDHSSMAAGRHLDFGRLRPRGSSEQAHHVRARVRGIRRQKLDDICCRASGQRQREPVLEDRIGVYQGPGRAELRGQDRGPTRAFYRPILPPRAIRAEPIPNAPPHVKSENA